MMDRNDINLGLYEKAMPAVLSFKEKLTLCKACGFDRMELSVDETEEKLTRLTSPAFLQELKEAEKAAGLPVYTLCLSGHRKYPLGSAHAEIRERSTEILTQAIRFSADAGIRIIQLAGYDVYYEESTPATRAWFLENLQKGVGEAASLGVTLAFETMETPFMNTVEKAMACVRLVNSPWLQVYPDVGNVRNATEEFLADFHLGQGHLAAAHLKETLPGQFRDLEFGQGQVDFPACIQTLTEAGVRLFTLEFWFDGHTDPAQFLRRNKAHMEACFSKAFQG